MSALFADTFYWVAILNADDAWHSQAVNYPVSPRLVMTQAIQIEVMDAFSSVKARPLAKRFWQATKDNPDLEIVPIESSLLSKAATLFIARADKAWSLTDCISFIVMQEQGMSEALTGDHHFEQAGFRALLGTGS